MIVRSAGSLLWSPVPANNGLEAAQSRLHHSTMIVRLAGRGAGPPTHASRTCWLTAVPPGRNRASRLLTHQTGDPAKAP
jgi:hypothetical protein